MKSFGLFFLAVLFVIAGFIFYNIQYPSDTRYIKKNGQWVIVDGNYKEAAQEE